jgi:hypothetical protein
MDNQCDKCGRELPFFVEDQELREEKEDFSHKAISITFGGTIIWDDGETDYDPGDQVDLCPACAAEFDEWWEKWYGVGKPKAT